MANDETWVDPDGRWDSPEEAVRWLTLQLNDLTAMLRSVLDQPWPVTVVVAGQVLRDPCGNGPIVSQLRPRIRSQTALIMPGLCASFYIGPEPELLAPGALVSVVGPARLLRVQMGSGLWEAHGPAFVTPRTLQNSELMTVEVMAWKPFGLVVPLIALVREKFPDALQNMPNPGAGRSAANSGNTGGSP